ncbi:MAG: hypothetical protein M1820_007384 [Bogoriella megaspora]|nr:MAG: hypothetical protein M1820_007384 [Bogoriella megaspora]
MTGLLNLPIEIRFMIYELVYQVPGGIHLNPEDSKCCVHRHALLLVCKTLKAEALEFLQNNVTFRLVARDIMTGFTDPPPIHRRFWMWRYCYDGLEPMLKRTPLFSSIKKLDLYLDNYSFGDLGQSFRPHRFNVLSQAKSLKVLRIAVFRYATDDTVDGNGLEEAYASSVNDLLGRAEESSILTSTVRIILQTVPQDCIVSWGPKDGDAFPFLCLCSQPFRDAAQFVLDSGAQKGTKETVGSTA